MGISAVVGGIASAVTTVAPIVSGGMAIASALGGSGGGGGGGGGGGSPSVAGSPAATAAPFSQYQPMYGQQLNELMSGVYGGKGNAALAQMPGYQAGLDAVQRSGAAQGFTGSGNMANALLQYGGSIFDKQLSTLELLSGAGINPGTAGQLQQSGTQANTQLMGQGINSLAYGAQTAANAFGGTSSGPYSGSLDPTMTGGGSDISTYYGSSPTIGSDAYSGGFGGTYNFGQ